MSQITIEGDDRRLTAPPPVVAGVDGSPTAIRAAQWAAIVAAARQAPLLLVHVVGRHRFAPTNTEVLDNARQAVVHRWAQTAQTPAPAITTLTLRGDPATRLIGLSATASEVVLGSVGAGSLARAKLGSVATTVAASSHSPVAVIRPLHSGAAAVGPIVVITEPTDKGASQALSAGLRTAAERRGDVVVVNITRPSTRASTPGTDDEIGVLLAERRNRFPSVKTRLVTYFGHPRTAVEKFSATAQLVVVSRGRRQLWPHLHGAAHTALYHARSAVVVVPEQVGMPTVIGRSHRHHRLEIADDATANR
ncbi:universal stress protein [Nocardia rhizosphaerihabitans]|uniref:Universal stress protein n=1 Tax=Nocardia rhizosphaerihabitans TaxID=1691570 RepID=A0ABQ2KCS5_9NOCA|nr:universal stress protein [Nocardia rhizosphaerihabitans]GGN79320.1 universal stress protein [Nocardia rhizosphaerihabitans]